MCMYIYIYINYSDYLLLCLFFFYLRPPTPLSIMNRYSPWMVSNTEDSRVAWVIDVAQMPTPVIYGFFGLLYLGLFCFFFTS